MTARECGVCGRPMLCEQPQRHLVCSPVCPSCWVPILVGDQCGRCPTSVPRLGVPRPGPKPSRRTGGARRCQPASRHRPRRSPSAPWNAWNVTAPARPRHPDMARTARRSSAARRRDPQSRFAVVLRARPCRRPHRAHEDGRARRRRRYRLAAAANSIRRRDEAIKSGARIERRSA